MADAYILQEQDPSYRDIEFSDRLAMLVDAQYNQRQDNRMKRLVKTAALDQPEASVMSIDYHSGRNLNRRMIQKLATCEYIVDSLNIFITGATGSGKTYLACALAMEALKQYIRDVCILSRDNSNVFSRRSYRSGKAGACKNSTICIILSSAGQMPYAACYNACHLCITVKEDLIEVYDSGSYFHICKSEYIQSLCDLSNGSFHYNS